MLRRSPGPHRKAALSLIAAIMLSCASPWAPAWSAPAIAIIIDDLGHGGREDRRAIELPAPVACAFLPHTPYAERGARAAHARGKEVLLHLPLQPMSAEWIPGPGAIMLDTTRAELASILSADLDAVPHVTGVSNHMGSLLTRHPGHMEWLMHELRARDSLYFVDSYTTASSVALQMADEHGVPAIKRDIFLDVDPAPGAILAQLERLKRIAEKTGQAVAIGHPYPTTMDLLEQNLPQLEQQGFRIVTVAEMIHLRGKDPWQQYSSPLRKASRK